VSGRTDLTRLERARFARIIGDDEHGYRTQLGIAFQLRRERVPIHALKVTVSDHHARPVLPRHAQRPRRGDRSKDLAPGYRGHERGPRALEERRVVMDYENGCIHVACLLGEPHQTGARSIRPSCHPMPLDIGIHTQHLNTRLRMPAMMCGDDERAAWTPYE